MATVQQVLDALAEGRMTLDDAAADFRSRRWPAIPKTTDAQAWGAQDDSPAHPDSFDTVTSDSRLSSTQYAQLAQAYTQAVGGAK